MTTATRLTTMTVVKVQPEMHEEKQKTISLIWNFIHATLYKNEVFTEREILNFHFLIGEHFDPTESYEKNFRRICVRTMLAKKYMEETPSYRLPRPAFWLNINFENGLTRTKVWYDTLIEKRRKVAAYGQPLFTLAHGVYKMWYSSSPEIFNLYRDKLLHLKAYNCLDVFRTSVLFINLSKY